MTDTVLPDVSEELWAALMNTYGRLRDAVRLLAADANTDPATAENWLQGKSLPQGETLIALMIASPKMNEAVFAAVSRRIEQTQARRAVWKVTYDESLRKLAAGDTAGGRGDWSKVTLRKQGNSVGVTFPAEILNRMGFEAGQDLTLVELADGVKLVKPGLARERQMRLAREVLRDEAETLRELAAR